MGTSKDLVTVTHAIAKAISTGEISTGDISAVRRLIPYQNLFFLQAMFDRMEESAKEAFAK
jgi:hypothetical protein